MKKYEKYKDSGVDWIGEIPEEWEVRKLKFILNFDVGGTPSTRNMEYFNGDNIWLCISDLKGKKITKSEKMLTNQAIKFSSLNKVKKGSLLYSFKLSIGNVAFTGCDLYTNEAIASFSSELNTNLNFWYYVLPMFIEKNANENIYGAKILNQFRIKNAFLINPKITEQQKISTFLDKKSEAIESFIKNKQKLIEFLEEERKTIITNAVTKGINPDVNYKKSGVEWIGDIPEHWEVRRTKYLFDLIVEPAKKNNDYELLSIYTDIGVKPRKDLEEKGNKASTTDGYWKVKKGDFIVNKLLAWMGAIGLSEYEGVTSPAYDILRKNIELDEKFYNHLFRCGILLPEIKRYSRGIMEMRLRLYFDEFGKIFLVYPPLKEQQQIVTYIEQESKKIDDLKEKYQREIDLIKEYKERLIYDVVTGKMNVQDYEIH